METQKNKNLDYNIGNKFINVSTTTTVKMQEYFTLITNDKTYDLLVDITADLKEIPEEYHESFLNMLCSKYLNTVSFGDNPFSNCRPTSKKKWFQFWKWSIFNKV